MALNDSDLFVVQDVSDKKFYKLAVKDLLERVESGDSVNLKGAADLNKTPLQNGIDPVTANNGDLYIVSSDADPIDGGWDLLNNETTAKGGDRIIYDSPDSAWILITSGGGGEGTVKSFTATLPLETDNDPVDIVLRILKARTNTEAVGSGDGKGASGYVQRLAEAGDVDWDTGTGSDEAVVTADLLKATNIEVNTTAQSVKDGQINFNAGNGLAETGDNATANQAGNTTKVFSVKTDGPSIEASVDGIKVVAVDGGEYAV